MDCYINVEIVYEALTVNKNPNLSFACKCYALARIRGGIPAIHPEIIIKAVLCDDQTIPAKVSCTITCQAVSILRVFIESLGSGTEYKSYGIGVEVNYLNSSGIKRIDVSCVMFPI